MLLAVTRIAIVSRLERHGGWMNVRIKLLLLALTASFLGCTGSRGIEQVGTSGRSAPKIENDNDVESKKIVKKPAVEEETEIAEVEYPELKFNGSGHTTYKNSDKFPMTSSIATQLETETLAITTVSTKIKCDPKCEQDEVDRDVAAKLGTTTYQRVPKQELNRLKNEEEFRYVSFAVFADEAQKPGGNPFQFETPLPVFPWPAVMSRYEDLEDGPQQWTSRVNGGQFNATVTVSLEGKSGDQVTIKFALTIPEDRDHKLYGDFPMPKEAVYVIDTKTKDVLRINSTSAYHGNKSKRGEFSVVAFSLCSKTTGGETDTFSCPTI